MVVLHHPTCVNKATVRIDPLHTYGVHAHESFPFNDGCLSRVPWDRVSIELHPFAPVLTAREPSMPNPSRLHTAGRPSAQGHAEAQVAAISDLPVDARASYLLSNLVGHVLRVFLNNWR